LLCSGNSFDNPFSSPPHCEGTGGDSGEEEDPWISAIEVNILRSQQKMIGGTLFECLLSTNISGNSPKCKDTKKEFSSMFTSPLKGQANTM